MSYVNLQIKSEMIATLFSKYLDDFEELFDYSSPLQICDEVSIFEFSDLCGPYGLPKNVADIISFLAARLSEDEIVCKDDMEDIEDMELADQIKDCLTELFCHEAEFLSSIDKVFFGYYNESDDGQLIISKTKSFICDNHCGEQRAVSTEEGERYLFCPID